MRIELREVARVLGLGIEPVGIVRGWSIDSRTIERGDLFFALRGPNHDGHEHIQEALRKGAVAVVAETRVAADGLVFEVGDSLGALQRIAKRAREK